MAGDGIEEWFGQGRETILVAGGGVAGLYAAWRLAEQNSRSFIVVIEARDVWGGKIQTVPMKGDSGEPYLADFGPMRYETRVQSKFKALCGRLGLPLEPFTGPSAPNVAWPKYDLREDEEQWGGKELLRHGLLLAIGAPAPRNEEEAQEVIDGLYEEDERTYDEIRGRRLRNQPDQPLLRDLTLWNALAAKGVLSSQAVSKIRELGTFYHMVDENVNAAEWIVWWLRALTSRGRVMETLTKGSSSLTDALVHKLRSSEFKDRVRLFSKARLASFVDQGNKVQVQMTRDGRPWPGPEPVPVDRLVLAMPRSGLLSLGSSLPERVRQDLDSVEAYALLKVFFVVRDPWWKHEQEPQTNASRTPTREIHYQRRPDDRHGMVMVYTDRPAVSYWQNYVAGKEHDRPEIDGATRQQLEAEFARFLAEEIQGALARATAGVAAPEGALELTEAAHSEFAGLNREELEAELTQRVERTGIRDWGRAPFEGAYHAWKPGWDSRQVIQRLKVFGQRGRIHVVGEAYSSYQGFIEGALRSVDLAFPGN